MVNTYKTIFVKRLLDKTRLAGAEMGAEHNSLFTAAINSRGNNRICFDWSGIEVATGSYLRRAYVPIFSLVQNEPIFTSGLNKVVAEDLELALEAESRAILIVESPTKGTPTLRTFGPLDTAYQQALTALRKKGESSAADLHDQADLKIGRTAWINRLTRLFEMGLISRTKAGKEFRYELISLI